MDLRFGSEGVVLAGCPIVRPDRNGVVCTRLSWGGLVPPARASFRARPVCDAARFVVLDSPVNWAIAFCRCFSLSSSSSSFDANGTRFPGWVERPWVLTRSEIVDADGAGGAGSVAELTATTGRLRRYRDILRAIEGFCCCCWTTATLAAKGWAFDLGESDASHWRSSILRSCEE